MVSSGRSSREGFKNKERVFRPEEEIEGREIPAEQRGWKPDMKG